MTVAKTKSDTITASQGLRSSSGISVYDWDRAQGALRGTSVLALYGGALATETGKKLDDDLSVLAGTYALQTYTPTGGVLATGELRLTAVGDEGAYDVVYTLLPTEENLATLGYAAGTILIYAAIGYKLPHRDQLAVGWDSNVYTRTWGTSQHEWGYRRITSS